MNKLPEVVLKEAAEAIERYGWISGKKVERGPEWHSTALAFPQCISNAVYTAAGHSLYAHPLLESRLGTLPGSLAAIWAWNDHPNRTKEEVLAVLRGEC